MNLKGLGIQDSSYLERFIGDTFPIKTDTPEKELWVNVLIRAFLDLESKSYKPTIKDYPAESFFFCEESPLRTILDLISEDTDFCVNKLREIARKQIDERNNPTERSIKTIHDKRAGKPQRTRFRRGSNIKLHSTKADTQSEAVREE